VLIGVAPGLAPDIVARLVGRELEKQLAQPFVVENRVGAGSSVAAKAVAGAAADGYTLFLGSATNISPVLLKNNAVEADQELTPVSRVYTAPFTVFLTGKLPFKTWPEFVAYAKANPGKANFGSPGSLSVLLITALASRSDMPFTVIPYKGGGDLVAAMSTGEVDFTVALASTFASALQTGAVRALFNTQRSTILPEVPTAAEAGIPNYDVTANGGLWAPHGTPRAVVQKLSAAQAVVASSPGVTEQARKGFGFDIVATTPDEELRNYQNEMKFWREAARLSNFQPQ
jgi:tripartite-type tricarboxylate transporter receptor subunit TctC